MPQTYDVGSWNHKGQFISAEQQLPTLGRARIRACTLSTNNTEGRYSIEKHSPRQQYPSITKEAWIEGRQIFTSYPKDRI